MTLLKTTDNNYPSLLKQIAKPPSPLHVRGKIKKQDSRAIAIVGTRKLSSYGKQVTPKIVQNLAKAGLTIVSGLALGIDALAHRAALEVGGRTIAVLGGGIDDATIYPRKNLKLAQKIISSGQGAIVSEHAPKTEPRRAFFPQRNRVIAGLSLGAVVIECPIKSGALITARLALDQNRDVFAVPGSIFWKKSEGCNHLISNSRAQLVSNAQQILEALNLTRKINFKKPKNDKKETTNNVCQGTTKEEDLILQHLSREPMHIDELVQKTNLSISQLNATLSIMDLKGLVKSTGFKQYVLNLLRSNSKIIKQISS